MIGIRTTNLCRGHRIAKAPVVKRANRNNKAVAKVNARRNNVVTIRIVDKVVVKAVDVVDAAGEVAVADVVEIDLMIVEARRT